MEVNREVLRYGNPEEASKFWKKPVVLKTFTRIPGISANDIVRFFFITFRDFSFGIFLETLDGMFKKS